MRKFRTTLLIAIFLSVLLGCTQSWALFGGFTGGTVYDPVRHVETKPTTAEQIKQVTLTATQIAHQVTDLASMSPEVLMAHILGVDNEFRDVLETMKQAQGLMKAGQTAQQAWDSAFKATEGFLEGKTSNIGDLEDSKKMIYVLDKTHQDSLSMAKMMSNIEEDTNRLREIMRQNQSVGGNKASKQVAGQLQAEKTIHELKKEQLWGTITAVIITEVVKENQKEAQAARTAFNTLNVGVADPYNPTEQDRANFKRPEGRGFIRF